MPKKCLLACRLEAEHWGLLAPMTSELNPRLVRGRTEHKAAKNTATSVLCARQDTMIWWPGKAEHTEFGILLKTKAEWCHLVAF